MRAYLLVLLVLVGCTTPEQRAAQQAQYVSALKQRCYAYGFKADDPALPNCVMRLDMAVRQAKAANDAQSQALAMQYLTAPAQQQTVQPGRPSINCWRDGDNLTCR